MTRRNAILALSLCLTATLCALCVATKQHAAEDSLNSTPASSPAHVALPQRRRNAQRSPRQRRRSPPPIRRAAQRAQAASSYRVFAHDSATHRSLACASCHKIESVRRIDVVEYPDHDACINCHRQQFFNGARPNICTVCHTIVSPRDGSRFKFPKPVIASEFNSIFPHDKHQYVIAELAPAHRARGEARFMRVSLTAQIDDTPPKPVESCATCHTTDTTERPAPAEWIEDKELNTPGKIEPVPTAGTFKNSPTGHASCFNCHWQSQQPIATNCAGCHELSKTNRVPHATPRPTSERATSSRTSSAALKVVTAHTPDVWLERISAKFRHEREDHKGFSCSSCHTNILEATSLADLAAEVPLATCSGCHAGTRKDIQREMDQVKADPAYSCTYCHLPNVGSRDIPITHFRVVGRTPTPPRAEAQRTTPK